MVRMMSEIKQDMGYMRQEWKQDIRQEVSAMRQEVSNYREESNSSIHNLETQLAQVTKSLAERPRGELPSTTENNPRERVQAITLRSGKELPDPILQKGSTSKSPTEEANLKDHDEKETEQNTSTIPSTNQNAKKAFEKGKEKIDVPIYRPPLPCPGRVKKDVDKMQYDALGQMLRYAKFLKDLLTNKKKLEESTNVVLGEECSAIVHKDMPQKLKDPGSFTIPCQIGETDFHKALADLGASINLMPFDLFKKLDLGTLKPTRICIQLVDRPIKHPKGVIEDVLVRVDKFIFPVDFVILDMDPDIEVPLILGRPFLVTARALIDVGSGKLVIRAGDECASFDVSKLTKYPLSANDSCYFVDILHEHIESIVPDLV
ncbi:PREDICTED: uncharacterized protein LOC109154451 [Ipomoea nil]|uniref:uncharacterized protein LOC109154451 n=1 Tax=Ipomoea nil TaxID=35883 RepID=UPI0009009C6C|nr:PREDICTED: uncharacterized protein LOC109154451 [Ipomoea nil]